jgi:hypothetical protein
MKTDGMLESAMECVNTERQRAREKWVGRVKPHGMMESSLECVSAETEMERERQREVTFHVEFVY